MEGGALADTGEKLQFRRERHLLSGSSAKLKGNNFLDTVVPEWPGWRS